MTKPIALLAGPSWLGSLLDKFAPAMEAQGAVVARTQSAADYLADPERAQAVAVLVTAGPVTREMIQAAPNLRAVVSPFIGIDTIDEAAASEHGVAVANGQADENIDSLAEATVLLGLSSLYDLKTSEAVLRENRPKPVPARARMLKGKTVGVIGYGRTAQGVIQRLGPWGVTLQLHTRTPPSPPPPGVALAALDALLATSDVVVVLASLNASTVDLLDARRLALLKPDAILVNVARGGIVNEPALVALMAQRPEMRVAFDVFVQQPPPPDSPMLVMAGAILTPHMVSHTRESTAALPRLATEQALAVLRGEPPRHMRNRDILPQWLQRWGAAP